MDFQTGSMKRLASERPISSFLMAVFIAPDCKSAKLTRVLVWPFLLMFKAFNLQRRSFRHREDAVYISLRKLSSPFQKFRYFTRRFPLQSKSMLLDSILRNEDREQSMLLSRVQAFQRSAKSRASPSRDNRLVMGRAHWSVWTRAPQNH